jgi:hypothetical protein
VSRNESGQAAGVLRRRLLPALVFLAGLVTCVPYSTYRAGQQLDISYDNIDMAWHLGLPMSLARGEWAGRDFIFTYGPLYQLTHAFGLLTPPHDLAALLRFFWLPDTLITLLIVWLALRLTGAPLAWRAAGYLLWVFFFPPLSMPPIYYTVEYGIKPLGGLLVPACAFLLPAGARRPGWATLLLCAALAPTLVLYSFDLGATVLGAIVAVVGTLFAATLRLGGGAGVEARRRALWAGAAVAAGLALFVAALWLAGWEGYFRYSLELASGYSAKFASAGKPAYFASLAAAVLTGLAALLLSFLRLRGALKSGDAAAARRTMALVGLAWFCLGWSRGGLMRSDYGHILMAAAPTLFLVGAFLPCYLRAEGRRLAGPAFAGALALMLATPYGWPHEFVLRTAPSAGLVYRVGGVRRVEFKPATLEVIPENRLDEIEAARALPGRSLFAWPHEAYLNVIAGKDNPVLTVQPYAALTEVLERETVRRLKSVPDLHVFMLTTQGELSEVENLTRTSIISRYLLEGFELAAPPTEKFALLRPASGGPRVWREEELALTPRSYAPGEGRSLAVGFEGEAARDVRASDLLLLRLRVSRTMLPGFRKPGHQTFTFVLSDGTERKQTILLPQDGRPHEILVSAATFRDPLFVSLFSRTKVWRSQERLVGLRLGWEPVDWLSARPREITLERVALLRREGAGVLETPLEGDAQRPLRAALYDD